MSIGNNNQRLQQPTSEPTFYEVPQTRAEDYSMIDPESYTSQFASQYFNQLPGAFSTALNAPDYAGQNAQFLQQFGDLTGAVVGATSPLQQQLANQVDFYTGRAADQISNQFAGMNSLYSSGMGKTAGEAAGDIAGQAGVTLGQAQLGLLNPLALQAMSGIQQGDLATQAQAGQLLSYGASMFEPTYTSPLMYLPPYYFGGGGANSLSMALS